MAKTITSNRVTRRQPNSKKYVLIGSPISKAPTGFISRKSGEIAKYLLETPRRNVFVSLGRKATEELLQAGLTLPHRAQMGELLMLEPPRPESIPPLSGLFERVVGTTSGHVWLPIEELTAVVGGKDAADRFIGGSADPLSKALALVRGDLSTLVIPFSFLKPAGDGIRLDFKKLAFADYGMTVSLGEYEASADGILYEFDADYRRRLHRKRRAAERSFGASLRRLRLQRGLKRSDFPGIAEKTISRIERNEVEKPHEKTLQIIAEKLGVAPDEIESY